jgi:hypothetical protein
MMRSLEFGGKKIKGLKITDFCSGYPEWLGDLEIRGACITESDLDVSLLHLIFGESYENGNMTDILFPNGSIFVVESKGGISNVSMCKLRERAEVFERWLRRVWRPFFSKAYG